MVCRKFHIKGLVQGVFYRAETEKKAKALQLTGWVRNRDDGSVICVACGEEDRLDAFETWLWQGSAASRVTDVNVEDQDLENFAEFRIVY